MLMAASIVETLNKPAIEQVRRTTCQEDDPVERCPPSVLLTKGIW
jgi:hypothetical protein